MFYRIISFVSLLVTTAGESKLTGVPLSTLRNTPNYNIGDTGSNLFVVDIMRPIIQECHPNGTVQQCFVLSSVGSLPEEKDETGHLMVKTSVIVHKGINVMLDCSSRAHDLDMKPFHWAQCVGDSCNPLTFSPLEKMNDVSVDQSNLNLVILSLPMRHSGITYACTDGTHILSWRFFIYEPSHYYTEIIVLCIVSFVLFLGSAILLLRDYVVYEKRYTGKNDDGGETVPLTSSPARSYTSADFSRKRHSAIHSSVGNEEFELTNIAEPPSLQKND